MAAVARAESVARALAIAVAAVQQLERYEHYTKKHYKKRNTCNSSPPAKLWHCRRTDRFAHLQKQNQEFPKAPGPAGAFGCTAEHGIGKRPISSNPSSSNRSHRPRSNHSRRSPSHCSKHPSSRRSTLSDCQAMHRALGAHLSLYQSGEYTWHSAGKF